MGYVFGEVYSREQAPWAYDAENDLPKSHRFYPAAAGLSSSLVYSASTLAAGGFTDLKDVAGAYHVVGAGKKVFVTDVFLASQDGKLQMQLMAGSDGTAGTGVRAIIREGGGSIHIPFQTPLMCQAGEKLTAQLYNAGTAATGELGLRVHLVIL